MARCNCSPMCEKCCNGPCDCTCSPEPPVTIESLQTQLAAMEADRDAQCALLAAGVERELNWQLRAERAESEANRRTRELELTYQVQRDLTVRTEQAEAERDRAVKRVAWLAGQMRSVDLYNLLFPHYDIGADNYAEAIDAALNQGTDHG